ncbi:MAG: diacylglycerol kinase family protein [Acidimicrobiia bacterium]
MTIAKGQPWGRTGPVPDSSVMVRSDQAAAAAIAAARRDGEAVPVIGLLGGDLCKTVGGTGDERRLARDDAVLLPCDLGLALLDGKHHMFVAHLVVRDRWWRGRIVAVMNAQWMGDWDVAPRSHPNDGRLDILDVAKEMPLLQRSKARRRLVTGTHVPHPDVGVRQAVAETFVFERPLDVYVDGVRVGPARTVVVRVEPDAFTIAV